MTDRGGHWNEYSDRHLDNAGGRRKIQEMRASGLSLAILIKATAPCASSDHSECRWAKPMRVDQSIQCPNDDPADMAQVATPDELARAIFGRPIEPAPHRRFRNVTTVPAREVVEQLEPLPAYDVEAACRSQNLNISSCVEYVQPFYDALKEAWPHLDESMKRQCVQRFPDNIHARYVQIQSCIAAELAKREHDERQRNPTRFRY